MQMTREKFENLPKYLGMTIVLLYLLGFMVVTRHLSRYGVSSFTLLRVQYLVAGFWLLVPITVYLAVGAANEYLHSWRRKMPPPRSWRGYLWVGLRSAGSDIGIWILLIAIVATLVALGLGSTGDVFDYVEKNLLKLLAIAAFATIIGILSSVAWRSLRRAKGLDSNFYRGVYFGTLGILLFVLYVSYFAANFYPTIPYSLGGGKPLKVVFLLKKQPKEDFLPVKPDNSARRSIPYELLLATDTTYVVKSPSENEKAIEFRRSAVLGMVVLDESTWRRDESRAVEAVKMRKLYVGNLPPQPTEQDLRNWFAQAGIHVDTINLIRDRYTDQPRGFAFIEISNDEEAERAIQTLNGMEFHGRTLVINEARPNRESE